MIERANDSEKRQRSASHGISPEDGITQARPCRRQTIEEMLAVGAEIAAMPPPDSR